MGNFICKKKRTIKIILFSKTYRKANNYLATFTALFSRITVTFICPG